METGRELTLWTVRLAVTCYVFALWRFSVTVRHLPTSLPDRLYVRINLMAWILCVAHVILAFAFFHDWSHQAAWDHTAAVTEQVTGLHWGGGLYVNYAFLVAWGYLAISNVQRRLVMPGGIRCETLFHAIAVFMMVNATAVFGPWWWKFIVPIPAIVLFLIQRRKL